MTISGLQVKLAPPSSMAGAVSFVRYAWESMPQCSLYAGVGAPGTGPDGAQPADMPGSTGVAAAPFQIKLKTPHMHDNSV